jgi:hypothetical protein
MLMKRHYRELQQLVRCRHYMSTMMRTPSLDNALKVLGVLGALGSFLWGVYVWKEKSGQDRDALLREQRRASEAVLQEQKRTSETRRVEATKPFLEHQLALYTEAIQSVEVMATSADHPAVDKATARFWQLYWGELGLVEDGALKVRWWTLKTRWTNTRADRNWKR